MIKKFLVCSVAAITFGAFVSCDDNEKEGDKIEKDVFPVISKANPEAYILTQGNYYSKIEGGLNVVDLTESTLMSKVFSTVNRRSLGATPQCGVAYGGKIYIGMYESNTIEVVDRYTFESVAQISLAGSTEGQQPRYMVAQGGKVYVSMFDGYVARLDTLTRRIDASVKVGPNPEKICIHKGKIYVPNSDGMNYENDYKNGTTVSVVSLSPFAVEKTLTVPLNPGNCVSAGNNVFVLCKGNYKEIPSKVYRIEEDGNTTEIASGNMITADGDKVYIVDAHWDGSGNIYHVYDATAHRLGTLDVRGVDYPNGIAVSSQYDRIIISSNVWGDGMPAYDLPGYIMEYKTDCTFIKRYESGVGEASIFFSVPLD